MTDFVGRTLGPYKLEVLLGKGGMASVYRAYQSSVKRYVAIKVMSPEIASEPGFVERFEREAEVIASLEHPHILPVIDYGTAENIHFLVMRYIEGGSLEERMRRVPLTLDEASTFLSQIASALNYAHKRGVIHRDLKPSNVLLDSGENAYLTDFGIARLAQSDSKLTATGSVVGTPAYMSPEQGKGQPVDARADIYSLGVILYEMVLDQLPFAAETPSAMIFQHVYETPPSPREIKPDLAESVVRVLNEAMAKSPDQRYQSAVELSNAFADAISDAAQPAHAPTQSPQSTERRDAPDMQTAAEDAATYVDMPATHEAGRQPLPSPTPFPTMERTSAGSGRSRLPLIALGVLLLLALLAGGAFFINANNVAVATQQTGTAVALSVQQTETSVALSTQQKVTAVAILALSATATPTNTPTPSKTPTPTNTPTRTATSTASNTPLPSATFTPSSNATMTAFAAQVSTDIAQSDQQTATAQVRANLVGTLAQQTRVAQTTRSAARTATAVALANNTPTSPPLKLATPSDAQGIYTGKAEDVLAQLKANQELASTTGSMAYSIDKMDVSPESAGLYHWEELDPSVKVSNFVFSAEVTWNATTQDNECGLVFRYTPSDTNAKNWTFYAATISRKGISQAYVRDKKGYRSPLMQQQTSAIQSSDGATNNLLVIGQGSRFRFYVNGTQVGTMVDDAYKTGSLALMGIRFSQSSGLVCKFSNVWVWSLE